MKRILSLLLILLLSILSLPVVIAAEDAIADNSEANGILVATKVFPKDFDMQAQITRADFAVYTARLFKVNDFEVSEKRYYVDVPMEHYALTSINYLTERNVLAGNGASVFRPNDVITVAEASKILVTAAGYENYAKSMGEYPAGYITAANRLGILPVNAGAEDAVTGAMARDMLFETLTTDFPEEVYWRDENAQFLTDESILTDYHKIYIREGVVEATNGMAYFGDRVRETDIITVDGVNLKNSIQSETENLLGSFVRAYYRSDDKGLSGELVYIYDDSDEKDVLETDIENYENIVGTTVSLENGNDIKKVSLDDVFYVVYNGSPYTGASSADAFKNLTAGKITFKNTDRNGSYDVVIIENATPFYTSFRSDTTKTLADTKLSASNIEITEYENVKIIDTDGKETEFTAVPQNSIISVYASEDKVNLKLVVSTKTVSGAVEKITERDGVYVAVIAGTEYEVYDVARNRAGAKLEPGANLVCYLDSFGKIAYFDTVVPGKAQPGYLTGLATEGVMTTILKLRVYGADGKIHELKCSEKVEIDGERYTDSEKARNAIPDNGAMNGNVKPQIILYTLNSAGEVSSIDTVNLGANETKATSLCRNIKFGDTVVYGSGRLGLKAVLNGATLQFSVPNDEDAFSAKEKNFTVGPHTFLEQWWTITVETYKFRGDSAYDNVVVRKDASATDITREDAILLVEEVSDVLLDDEVTKQIKGLLKGGEVTFTVDPDVDLGDIAEGDAIRVGEANGVIGKIELIYDYSKGGLPDWPGVDDERNWYTTNASKYYWSENQISFGYVIRKNEDIVEISYKNNEKMDEVYNQLHAVMVYDPEAPDPVYVGTIADIRDRETYGEDCSRIMFQTFQGKYMGVIVYR